MDATFVADGVQLCPQPLVLIGQLDDARLQNPVIHSTLLPRSFGRFIVATSSIPVRLVLACVGCELTLFALGNDAVAVFMVAVG